MDTGDQGTWLLTLLKSGKLQSQSDSNTFFLSFCNVNIIPKSVT